MPQKEQQEDKLPNFLPGFDLAAGLERLRGNKRLYRKLMLDFGADYQGATAAIREALDTGNLASAHGLVHDLKGPAGNLAATDLLTAAIEMEELIKNCDSKSTPSKKTLNQMFSKLKTALNQALESVNSLPALSNAGEDDDELSIAAIISQTPELPGKEIERISKAAKKGDIEELIAIANELHTRSDAYTPLSEKLIQLTENLDFEVILESMSETV